MWDRNEIRQLLQQVARNTRSVDGALQALACMPYEDIGCARVDHHRALRQGMSEVIFCAPKTPDQVAQIVQSLAARHDRILGTRATREHYRAARAHVPELQYDQSARALWLDRDPHRARKAGVAVVCAGTGDLPITDEAALALELLGHRAMRLTDVGVAGLHRLLDQLDTLQRANVIIVVAGMDGALPGVVAGLLAKPVIAVPTSIGYGANFAGVAPLLTMLNACAAGVAVVNIDNGYGAAHLAAMINDLAESDRASEPQSAREEAHR